MPEPTGFMIPLLYSDFFGDVPTRQALEEFVRVIPWRMAVKQVVGCLSISWQGGIEQEGHQRAFTRELIKDLLYASAVELKMERDPKSVLFTREGLQAVLRVAIAEQSPGAAFRTNYSDSFTKAVLAANEILMLEITPVPRTGTVLDLVPTELRSIISNLENPNDLLARTDAFFRWSSTAKARASKNYLPVESDLVQFTGLTPIEFAAGAYMTFARSAAMTQWQEVERLGVAFSIVQWMHDVADTRVIRQWLSVKSIALDVVRKQWKNETSLSLAGAGALWSTPVIQEEADLFFVPIPALVENCMGDGTFFTLMDGYREAAGSDQKARKEAVERYTRFYGEFFEDHVASVFEQAFENRTGDRFTREMEYIPGTKSSDVIIAEGDNIIFVEVVAKRTNLVQSVLRLSPSAIAQDIQSAVIDKAWQLHRNIEDFRIGTLLPDFPRRKGQRFFPVVVAPHDRPRITVINSALEDAQEKDGLLAGAEPLEMLDLGEIEQLETALSQGLSFSGLLDRKNRSDRHSRMMSLHNYLIYMEPNTLPPGMSPTRRRGSEVAQRIMDLARTWAQPVS